ncbi:MAG: hypothetical protein HY291_10065 [Planctomycetes bacterium]|nr:hypothetical protein [Planctomycetota bacterium]
MRRAPHFLPWLLLLSLAVRAEEAKTETPTPPAADPAAGLAELRKTCFEHLQMILAKGPVKDVPWAMGAATQKATFDKADAKQETVHANFGGTALDLKWKTIETKQLAELLRVAAGPDDALDAKACVLAAALTLADQRADAAEKLIDRALAKDPGALDQYKEWVKKLGAMAEPPKPKPVSVSAPKNTTGPNASPASASAPPPSKWTPLGLSGGGAMFSPAISPADPKELIINCDMSGVYLSQDDGANWRIVHWEQLHSNTGCRPGFHPTDANVIFASAGWRGLKVTRDRGEHWEPFGDLQGRTEGEIAIDPGNPNLMFAGADGAAWRSLDGGKTWKKCDGPKGKVLGFHIDQTTPPERRVCFVGTPEGVWRSDDGGGAWAEKSSGLPWKNLRWFSGGSNAKDKTVALYVTLPSKNDGGKLAGGVYRSLDKGEKWESAMGAGINTETKRGDEWSADMAEYIQVLTNNVKPLTVWAFNKGTKVLPPHHCTAFRSDDGGKNWRATFFGDPRSKECNVDYDYQVAATGQHYPSVPESTAIDPNNPEHVMTVDEGRCFITNDGGKSWRTGHARSASGSSKPGKDETFICNGLVVTSTWHYYIDPFDPNRHYIAYTDIGFARSLDAGKTWRWLGPGEWPPWVNTCYEVAFDPEIAGKAWGAFSNVHDIPNNNIIGGGHGANGPGGVCVSVDHCAGWKTSNQGLPEAPALSVVVDPKSPKGNRTLYAAIWEHGVFKSTDDGKSWTKKSTGLGAAANMRTIRVQLHPDGTLFCLVTAKRGGGGFLGEGVGLYRSKDAGESWEQINKTQVLHWPKDFTVDSKDSKTLYIGAANAGSPGEGGLYRTTDGGATWKKLCQHGPEHFGAFLHPKRPGWIYATLAEGAPESALWLSKDNGATWQPLKDLPFNVVQRVEFDPANDNQIYVCTFGGSIWRGPAE